MELKKSLVVAVKDAIDVWSASWPTLKFDRIWCEVGCHSPNAGIVESTDERGGVAIVCVAMPEPVYVKLTHRALTELGLEARTPVHLIVKRRSIQRLG